MRFVFNSAEVHIEGDGPIYSVIPIIERLAIQLEVQPIVEVSDEDRVNFSIVMTNSASSRDFDEVPVSGNTIITGSYPCMAFVPCFEPAELVNDFMLLLNAGFRIK